MVATAFAGAGFVGRGGGLGGRVLVGGVHGVLFLRVTIVSDLSWLVYDSLWPLSIR
jgi:hypothetical protein